VVQARGEELDTSLLKTQISRLSRHTFASFVTELFSTDGNEEGHEGFFNLPEAGEDVFYQPLLDSYGGSIHRVYLLHFPPLDLFHPSLALTMNDPVLVRQLVKVRNLYKGRVGQWGMISPFLREDNALKAVGFVTNLVGIEQRVYQEMLIPAYQRLKRFCGMKKTPLVVGSCDSFIDLVPEKTERVFQEFIRKQSDGLAIAVSANGAHVAEFNHERWMTGGVLSPTAGPYEPVFVSSGIRHRAVLNEFESLLREDTLEAKLEEFLVTNYKDVFGNRYDRVETQLWLRFPDLDITDHNRRLDVFLRNSIDNDWELFEVKRPVAVSGTYRDVPVIAKEVTNAIQQVKNYGRILAQDKAKKYFANQGIEYYEPRLNVVIGRTPQIPHDQWRWLKTSNEDRVRIVTFDDLMRELKGRIEDRFAVIAHTLQLVSTDQTK
jgi:antiviral defense system Shedu protein SduA